jgi:hypothetical protein
MNSDQALSLQSALLKIAAIAAGSWTPSRAVVGDVTISTVATIAGGRIFADLSVIEGRSLVFAKNANFSEYSDTRNGAASFRVSAVASLADLEFDTIRDAFDRLRAEVHSAQLDALAKIAAIRGAEAAGALH